MAVVVVVVQIDGERYFGAQNRRLRQSYVLRESKYYFEWTL